MARELIDPLPAPRVEAAMPGGYTLQLEGAARRHRTLLASLLVDLPVAVVVDAVAELFGVGVDGGVVVVAVAAAL